MIVVIGASSCFVGLDQPSYPALSSFSWSALRLCISREVMTSLSPDSEPSIPPPMRHIQTIAYTLPPPTGPGNLLSSSAAIKALAELLT